MACGPGPARSDRLKGLHQRVCVKQATALLMAFFRDALVERKIASGVFPEMVMRPFQPASNPTSPLGSSSYPGGRDGPPKGDGEVYDWPHRHR